MALITFKGISQNSSISKPLTDEEFESIGREYYAEPTDDQTGFDPLAAK
jgi:hypothetical protein